MDAGHGRTKNMVNKKDFRELRRDVLELQNTISIPLKHINDNGIFTRKYEELSVHKALELLIDYLGIKYNNGNKLTK